MKTGILASASRLQAWQRFAGENTSYTVVQDSKEAKKYELFLDLDFDSFPHRINDYAGNTTTLFLLSAVCCTPEAAMVAAGLKWNNEKIFGFNAIPTFIERKGLECTNPFDLKTNSIEDVASYLGYTHTEIVKSRIGMVTPRILFMIINEAFYTLQEGTAEAADIDVAMKLGTNYPHGPFEWCEMAGLHNVYQTLEAMYSDTHEERYKICPAMKTAWLRLQVS